MKTLFRLTIIALVAIAIYFATIGTNDFYRLLDFIEELIQMIAGGYLKK